MSSKNKIRKDDIMYKLLDKPYGKAILDNGSTTTPVATLINESGGVSHIIEDDHCYVLVNGGITRNFKMTHHWYPEAIDALKTLPTPTSA